MKRGLTLICAALLGSSSSAMAQPPVVVTAEALPSRTVSYADLNISSSAGQDRLVRRIRAAARDLCLENNVDQLKIATARRTCFQRAVGDGYDKMNSAMAARAAGKNLAVATLVIRAW